MWVLRLWAFTVGVASPPPSFPPVLYPLGLFVSPRSCPAPKTKPVAATSVRDIAPDLAVAVTDVATKQITDMTPAPPATKPQRATKSTATAKESGETALESGSTSAEPAQGMSYPLAIAYCSFNFVTPSTMVGGWAMQC